MKFWQCNHTWKKSAKNTLICLIGCALGDNAVILAFQLHPALTIDIIWIMLLAMFAGLLSSITLETLILLKQLPWLKAMHTALGMSIISMLMMEAAANLASIIFAGGNRLALSWWSIVPAWLIAYLAAWAYNYYQLKKHGKSCHG